MNFWKIESSENNQFPCYISPCTEFFPSNSHQGTLSQMQPISFPFFFTMPSFTENSVGLNPSAPLSQNSFSFGGKKEEDKQQLEEKAFVNKSKKCDKKDGNTKANIIRDFVRSIKKDATPALLAKKSLGSDYSLKKFMELMLNFFPSDEKYYRFKKLLDICQKGDDSEFSALLRTVFYNFLRGEYQMKIILKKRNKLEYLSVCRQMMAKMVSGSA